MGTGMDANKPENNQRVNQGDEKCLKGSIEDSEEEQIDVMNFTG